MIKLKQLAGILNTDDNQETIPANHHSMASNIRFRGTDGQNMRPESVPGTRQIFNGNLPAGINEGIGAYWDELKQRIFWCNYNPTHPGIYLYDISAGTISFLAIDGTNSVGAFQFNLQNPIVDMRILYGDATEGDILYFNNSLKQPCKINIDRALSGGYGTIIRSYIDVAKAPPSIPPASLYEDDPTILVNNLRKKLFIPKYRWWYDDKEKSVWSEWGELPLPNNYTDTDIDKDPTKNARIALIFQTGPNNVKKIEIAFAQSIDNVYSDFFQVAVLDKALLSIPDNDIYAYRFFNNQAYNYIDVTESTLLQDKTPLEANALEFLNGNVPIYGGIKEGYTPATIIGSASSDSVPAQTTKPPFIFVVNQSGDSGFGVGNIHIMVIGGVPVPIGGGVATATFNIKTTGTTISFPGAPGYTSSVIINGLMASAISNGFTIISFDTENLIIIKANEVLLLATTTNVFFPATDSFAFNWNSTYAFALQYFDAQGGTIGMVTNPSMTIQTPSYSESGGNINIPQVNISITNRPPPEAASYSVGRSGNLTMSNFRDWVSDRTFKDDKYAYISIENLNTFIKDNPSAAFLAYDFSSGDRIRFIKQLSNGQNTIYNTGTPEDYEILASVLTPTINGVLQTGQFIKIALPSTDATFDFGIQVHAPFPNPLNYNNYQIVLYTPALSVANGLNLLFEFGERFSIGNYGLPTAFHQGQIQNQSADLTVPALYSFIKGDDYYRVRAINTGAELDYGITSGSGGDSSAGQITLGCTFESATYTDPNVLTGNSPYTNLIGFNLSTDNSRWIIKIISGTYTFRIQGTLTITFVDNRPSDVYGFFLQKNTGVAYTLVPDFDASVAGTYSFTVDTTFTMNSGERIFIFGISQPNYDHTRTMAATQLTITRQLNYNIGIIDQNFSDFFQSAVNSNGRTSIVDPNAAQVYNSTLLRWALAYQVDTNINQANRFYPLNFDQVDVSRGDIRRLKARERELRIFQSIGTCVKGIYAKYVQSNTGSDILTTTGDILTQNNTKYYEGFWGMGNQNAGLASGKIADYFIHPQTGQQIRVSQDGMIPISTLYKGQYFLKSLLIPYNNNYIRADGGTARIISFYDHFEDQCMTILQAGTLGFNNILPYVFSFNEKRNAYCCFYDFHPEWAICAQDKIYSWLQGQLYVHDDETAFRTFYGVPFTPSITLVFNEKVPMVKSFLTIGYQSNQIWQSNTNGDVKTSTINPQTGLQQISQLITQDYQIQEDKRYAAFLRDANSMQNAKLALVEGDYLKGQWIQVKLTYVGQAGTFIYAPFISYADSPKNF